MQKVKELWAKLTAGFQDEPVRKAPISEKVVAKTTKKRAPRKSTKVVKKVNK